MARMDAATLWERKPRTTESDSVRVMPVKMTLVSGHALRADTGDGGTVTMVAEKVTLKPYLGTVTSSDCRPVCPRRHVPTA